MQLKFTLRCSHCGHNAVAVPDETDPTNIVRCDRCSVELCTIDEFNAKVRDVSAEAAAKHLRNLLNGIHKEPAVIELEL